MKKPATNDVFNEIFENYVNGNKKDAIAGIKKLSKEDRKNLCKYVAALQDQEFNETLDWFMGQAIG